MIGFSVVEFILRYTGTLFERSMTYHRIIDFLLKLEMNIVKRRRFDTPITIYDLTTKEERELIRRKMR